MTPVTAIKTCFRKYATLSGRASRSEFWGFALFHVFILHLARMIDIYVLGRDAALLVFNDPFIGPFGTTAIIALVIPLLAAHWRRMHDVSRPGWHFLYPLLIMIGGYLIISAIALAVNQAIDLGTGEVFMAEHASTLIIAIQMFTDFGLLFSYIMSVIVVLWLCLPSTAHPNKYGPNPNEVPS